MDKALTGLISGIKDVLSRDVRSVSAGPTQGSAYMNHHVMIMKNSEHTPGYKTWRETSLRALSRIDHPCLRGRIYATVRLPFQKIPERIISVK